MKVILYARVSSDEQAKQNLSLGYQLERMREYCHNRGCLFTPKFARILPAGK